MAENDEQFILGFRNQYQVMLNKLEDLRSQSHQVQARSFTNRVKGIFGGKFKIDFEKLEVSEQKFLQVALVMSQLLNMILATALLTFVTHAMGKPHDPADILLDDGSRTIKVQAKVHDKVLDYLSDMRNDKYNDMQRLVPQDKADQVGHLLVDSKGQYIVSSLLSSGNVND